jgi:hypothetical protein
VPLCPIHSHLWSLCCKTLIHVNGPLKPQLDRKTSSAVRCNLHTLRMWTELPGALTVGSRGKVVLSCKVHSAGLGFGSRHNHVNCHSGRTTNCLGQGLHHCTWSDMHSRASKFCWHWGYMRTFRCIQMGRCRAGAGQVLGRCWAGDGQVMGTCLASAGQVMGM